MTVKHEEIRVDTWDPRYHDAFIDLNREWVEYYFHMEETDRKYLYKPEETIIEPGGDVVFLLLGERVVGTCALVPEEDGVLELAKMAVDKSERGKGLGNILLEKTLERARDMGAHKIVLRSNTAMKPAIALYKKYGFRTVRMGPHPDYERADIEMALDLPK
jgi:ribosomal protein S18 acetylase RimI-like enzyme